MINKESQLLGIFAKEPWREFTFTELKKISRKKSKSYIDMVLKKFLKEQILKQEKVGHLPVYSLDLSSSKARAFAGFALEYEAWHKKNIPYKDMQKLMSNIPTYDYIFIIAGSYAKNMQKERSDIDVTIIVDDSFEPKRAYASLSYICELNIPPVHLYVFRNKEFIEMLCNNEFNYGKEISKNNIILASAQIYLKLIEEAIEHGFRNK